jgi:hypothetical protein
MPRRHRRGLGRQPTSPSRFPAPSWRPTLAIAPRPSSAETLHHDGDRNGGSASPERSSKRPRPRRSWCQSLALPHRCQGPARAWATADTPAEQFSRSTTPRRTPVELCSRWMTRERTPSSLSRRWSAQREVPAFAVPARLLLPALPPPGRRREQSLVTEERTGSGHAPGRFRVPGEPCCPPMGSGMLRGHAVGSRGSRCRRC